MSLEDAAGFVEPSSLSMRNRLIIGYQSSSSNHYLFIDQISFFVCV